MVNFYSITYDANGSTAGITPVMQAAESSRESYYFALDEGKGLRKSGYSFIGWAEDKDATDPKYIAGSTISLSSDKPNKILYAVWRVDKAWADITKMQELTPNTCKGLALNTSKQLTDDRDSKLYWVTRLADGNCWMTQNLDYDITTEDMKGIVRFDKYTGVETWPSPGMADEIPRYYDPGDYYYTNTSSWERCSNTAVNFTDSSCKTAGWTTSGDSHFSIGNYYNWYAITKGSWRGATTNEAVATDSICPAGWVLPKANIDKAGSFGTSNTNLYGLAGRYNLDSNAESAIVLRDKPLYFVPGGDIRGGFLFDTGKTARYWSSVRATNNVNAYDLTFYSTAVQLIWPSGIGYGMSARCLVIGS